jgi:hypothetical protein
MASGIITEHKEDAWGPRKNWGQRSVLDGQEPGFVKTSPIPNPQPLASDPLSYLGSMGLPAFSHAPQPPFKTQTWEKPRFRNCCATRALLPSFLQAQYTTILLFFGRPGAQVATSL